MDDWLPLTCSFCSAKFRIQRQYAHLRGRCPACGFRIAAPFPLPYEPPTHVSSSNEPLGLIPIEEEWPEPARLEVQEERPVYDFSAKPTVPPPSAPSLGPGSSHEIFKLADDKPIAPQPGRPTAPAPVVTPYRLSGELASAPPAFPPPSSPPRPAAESLPVVELVSTAPPPKPQPDSVADAAPPAPAPAPPPRPPANMIDALFQEDPQPPVAPAIHVDAAPEIPVAELAPPPPDPSPPPRIAPAVEPIPVAKLATEEPTGLGPARIPQAASAPPPAPAPPPPIENASGEGIGSPPSDNYYTYQLNRAELKPIRTSGPKRPFARGVFDFPWRPNNLGPLLWTALGVTILSLQGSLILLCLGIGPFGLIGVLGVGVSVLGVMLFAGTYAASCLLTNIQDTAAGNDEVEWPDASWRDGLFPLFQLAWIGLCCGVVCGFVSLVTCLPVAGVSLVVAPPMFLIMLLSSMAGDSWFTLIHGRVLDQLGRRFLETVGVIVGAMLLMAVTMTCAILSVGYAFYLAPLTGLVASASWLMLGRLIGRLGWVLTQDAKPKKRKKKKKKRRAEERELRTENSEETTEEKEAEPEGASG